MRLRCWDFAGQAVYCSTHTLFLSPAALFAVTVNLAQGFGPPSSGDSSQVPGVERALTWVTHVYSKVPEARIVVVGTHVDEVESPAEAARRLRSVVEGIGAWKATRLARLQQIRRTVTGPVAAELAALCAKLACLSVVGACAVGCRDGQALVTRPGEAPFGIAAAHVASTAEDGMGHVRTADHGAKWVTAARNRFESAASAVPTGSARADCAHVQVSVDTGAVTASAADEASNSAQKPVKTQKRAFQRGSRRRRHNTDDEALKGMARLSMRSVGGWLAELAYCSLDSVGRHHPAAYMQLASLDYDKMFHSAYVSWKEFEAAVSSSVDLGGRRGLRQAVWYLNAAGVVVWHDRLFHGRLRDMIFVQPAYLTQLLRVFVHSVEDDDHSPHGDAPVDDPASLRSVSLAELARHGCDACSTRFYRDLRPKLRNVVVRIDTEPLAVAGWPPADMRWDRCDDATAMTVWLEDLTGSILSWNVPRMELRTVLDGLGVRVARFATLQKLKGKMRRRECAQQLTRLCTRKKGLTPAEVERLLVTLGAMAEYRDFAVHNRWIRSDDAAADAVLDETDVTSWFHSARQPTPELKAEYKKFRATGRLSAKLLNGHLLHEVLPTKRGGLCTLLHALNVVLPCTAAPATSTAPGALLGEPPPAATAAWFVVPAMLPLCRAPHAWWPDKWTPPPLHKLLQTWAAGLVASSTEADEIVAGVTIPLSEYVAVAYFATTRAPLTVLPPISVTTVDRCCHGTLRRAIAALQEAWHVLGKVVARLGTAEAAADAIRAVLADACRGLPRLAELFAAREKRGTAREWLAGWQLQYVVWF